MNAQVARRLFSRSDYHRMAEAGILTQDDRVELLDGEIVRMTPIGIPHASSVDRLTTFFVRRFSAQAIVRVQNPIVLSDWSEPQPDLALLALRADFYADHHPEPHEVLLAVEVMDTSASHDRTLKLPLYARAPICEVWLIDLRRQIIEVCRQPTPTGYRQILVVERGQRLAPQAFPRRFLRVDDLLGPPRTSRRQRA
ncbi:MAG: Uma2 family endonuclease [bacterium]